MSGQGDHICFLSQEPGFAVFTFPLHPQEIHPSKRAKFNPFRRAEVAAVRKKGSCLRCKLLKIKCSGTDPCDTCYKLAQTIEQHLENKTLRFAECIRTQIKDISIFESKLHDITSPDVHTKIETLSNLMDSINLKFAVEWDFDKLLNGAISWLENQKSPSVSQVGILCSPEFAKLIEEGVPQDVSRDFQLMLWSISLAHCLSCTGTARAALCQDLEEIGTLAGYRFLLELDRHSRSGYIMKGTGNRNQPPTDAIKANFFLILGTVIGIQYTTAPKQSRPFPTLDSETGSQTTLWNAMRDHLCLMLTHHLIFLGSRLGIPVPPDFEHKLLASSARLWDKKGEFVWILNGSQRIECIDQDKTGLSMQPDSRKSNQPDSAVLPEGLEEESKPRYKSVSTWECCECGGSGMPTHFGTCCCCGHVMCSYCAAQNHSIRRVV